MKLQFAEQSDGLLGMQAEFEASPGSITVPALKHRSVSVSLPGRFNRSRPTVNHQYTVASGAYCNIFAVSGAVFHLCLM